MKVLLRTLFATLLPALASAQPAGNNPTAKADSLFNLQQWKAARSAYEGLLQQDGKVMNALAWNRLGLACYNLGDYDKALEYYRHAEGAGPASALKPVLYSRLAKVYAMKNQPGRSLEYLRHAVDSGYINLREMDTARAFGPLRSMPAFITLVQRATVAAFPCMADAHKREFDFWVGEWDVYVTGTGTLAGHSLIQKASGECMILENWTSMGPVPFNGKSMNYVNPQTNKWEQLWIGSGGGGAPTRFYDGAYKDSVMQFAFEVTNAQGKQAVGKFRFFHQGPDQVRQLSETSADGGKTWTINYDFTYKRKKAK